MIEVTIVHIYNSTMVKVRTSLLVVLCLLYCSLKFMCVFLFVCLFLISFSGFLFTSPP